jgi:plasmid stabilization system protein ParE
MRYRLSDLAEQDLESYVICNRVENELLIARVLHGRRDQIAAWQQRPADETER